MCVWRERTQEPVVPVVSCPGTPFTWRLVMPLTWEKVCVAYHGKTRYTRGVGLHSWLDPLHCLLLHWMLDYLGNLCMVHSVCVCVCVCVHVFIDKQLMVLILTAHYMYSSDVILMRFHYVQFLILNVRHPAF